MDELLQTGQHQDAVQSLRFPAVSTPRPPGRQGSDVRRRGPHLIRTHRFSSGNEVYQSGGPPRSNQAHRPCGRRLPLPHGLRHNTHPRVLDWPRDHQGFLQPSADRRPAQGARGGPLYRLGDRSFAFHRWCDPAVSSRAARPGGRREGCLQP